jgi:pimeloyl-ACP methyl ester carboxylesterase
LLEVLLGPSDDLNAKDVFLKTFAGPPGPTPESILPRLKCPILAIWGGADPWTPVNTGLHPGSNFYKYAAGDFQLHVLPGVGHCPHDEAPEQVHAVMIPWMKQLTYDPTTAVK